MRIYKKSLMFGFVAAVAMMAPMSAARADSTDDVNTRPRPEYDAKGLPLGAFRAYPVLQISGTYDDNIYSRSAGTGDGYFTIAPSIDVKSEWSRHMLNLRASLASALYADNTSENTLNWLVGADGRLDVQRGIYFEADFSAQQMHEPRSSPDTPLFAAEPTPYKLIKGGGSFLYQPSLLGISIGGDVSRFDFGETIRILAAPLNNDDRDRTVYTGFAKAMYAFSPGYSAYVRGQIGSREYDQFLDRSGLHRDSQEYSIDAGLTLELGHLLLGDVYAGYQTHQYTAPLPDVSGFNFGVGLAWYATQLTTVRLDADRKINDTTVAGASGTDDTQVLFRVDHELLRNVLLHGQVGFTDSQFKGVARHDQYVYGGIAAEYKMNSYLSVNLGYGYEHRDSNLPGTNYNSNKVTLALTAHL